MRSAPRPGPGTVPAVSLPSGTTGGPGTDSPAPSATGPGPAPRAPGATANPGAAARGGSALGVRDVADLIPAARTARAAITASGRGLSREALADRMRDDGHGVSNARASLLVKILKAEDTTTRLGAEPVTPDSSEPGEHPDRAA